MYFKTVLFEGRYLCSTSTVFFGGYLYYYYNSTDILILYSPLLLDKIKKFSIRFTLRGLRAVPYGNQRLVISVFDAN